MNLPEGFVLDEDVEIGNTNLPEGFVLDEEVKSIKDVGTLNQMKASGQELTREQERALWDAEEQKPLSQKASEAASAFLPAAWDIAKQAGTGAGEFIYKGILKPIDAISQTPEEAEKTLKEAKNTLRSGAVGVARDIQESVDAAVRFGMFGSDITDKLLGRSDDERFERYMLRESMRQFSQKVYEDNPDAAARLLAENPILQKMAYAAALAQGGTPEEAELAKKAYSELVLESGLTKDEINENVATLGEIMSPVALPGTNRVTNAFGKATGKVTQKAGELALKGVVAPTAKAVAKTAGGIEKGVEATERLSRRIGEYAIGDPDTFVKTATNTLISIPVKIPAKTTRGIATTIADIAGEAGYGRRGMFERAGRKVDAGELTKRLFGPESLGGKGRARMADWAVRQTNAIVQPAVNGAVLNVVMGLPDIESAADLGFMAGTGAGIGAFGGSRMQDRAFALVDPTTSLAQKIDAVVTPDPAAYRKDQDADIKRFLATADTSLLDSINELSNIDNIKSSLDLKIKNLEGKKIAQIRDEDAQRIQENIDLLSKQRKELDKTSPQTEAEIKRQIQLSFADAMDLAKTTGAAAGLNNIEVKVLKPDQMEAFYRERYGKNLTDAEAVRRQLIGNPNLSPSEQELLKKADETIARFLNDLAGSSNARGFAVAERPDMPGQKGATIVINGDLVTQMGRDGLNLSRVINHEMQHALANFEEVRQMLAPLRKELFDQKIQNPDDTFEVVSKGTISDAQLDAYALQYAAGMDASGGTSFLGNFADQNQVREYMKEEVLSELAGLSGASHGDIRAGLDSVGRQAVDWLETKTRSGALKRVKEGLRQFGVLVDDQGQFTSVLGAELSPEALAMMRQYQRKLRDLNESLVYNSDPRKDEPDIPLTELATNRAFQQRYKDSEFFEQEQVISMQAPDGSKQEIPVPANAQRNPLVGKYTFANGQLVDDAGNVVSFGPDIALQAMPDGTVVTLDTRVARNPDGSPRILSPRETKRRAKERGDAIREAIDNAPEDESGVRLEDTGNGNYRGTLSPAQIAAINALPNDVVAPSLKRKISFFNDILGKKDGSIVEIEYQAALRDGKYRALKPQLRTEIPIGFQFDKQGNFLMTTMSVSRMYDKANAWAAKSPRNLRLWGGDMTKFWDSVRQYTLNHQKGVQGHIGLHPDPYIAMRMKNRINDLFNVYRKETREANPERTTLPKRRGQDSRDVIIRSRRMDRVNSYDETALAKMPFQYELAVQNYLPAENPLADFQSPEQFAKATEVDQNLVNRAIAGDIESLEAELSNEDILRPMEYVDVRDGQIRIRSMADPTQGFLLEPEESAPEMPAVQFMPAEAIEAPSGERGFQSKLQMEIQGKFRGAMATPEQLKAVVNNPQNVKAEEVKWSGVNDAIDRLASENNGKVPVQELLNYLRDEGQVKFEEIKLGGTAKTWTQDEINALERQAQRTGNWDAYERAVLEYEDQQLGSEANQTGNRTKYSKYQLAGGENYREVVMAMPSRDATIEPHPSLEGKWVIRKEDGNLVTNPTTEGQVNPGAVRYWDSKFMAEQYGRPAHRQAYTSTHFPDIPNYVAHMRLNERTDAEGNDGLFIEELQSDRHQAGRDVGYIGDKLEIPNGYKIEKSPIRGFLVFDPEGNSLGSKETEVDAIQAARMNAGLSGAKMQVPDAPFRKDWGVQLFKRALRDAVESGKQWIGWTTGETQAERYDLSKQVGEIRYWKANEDGSQWGLQVIEPNGQTIMFEDEYISPQKVVDTIGKEMFDKMQNGDGDDIGNDSKSLSGDNLKIGGEGMKGFYDTILPKEIGKYVSKMGGKVEKSEIGQSISTDDLDMGDLSDATPEELAELEATGKVVGDSVPIWRVNITPQMENVVRAGQLQFMPAEVDARYIDLEAKAKAGDKEAEAEAQRMVDEAAKAARKIAVSDGSIPYNQLPENIQKEADFIPNKESTSWKLEQVSVKELMENSPAGMTGDVSEIEGYDIGSLIKSIRKDGVKQPIVMVRNADGSIDIEGNHRVYAAYEAGLDTIPAYVLQEKSILSIALNKNPASAALRDKNTGEVFYGEPLHGLLHDKIPNIENRDLEAGFATIDGEFITGKEVEEQTGMDSGEELFNFSQDERREYFEVQRENVIFNNSLTIEEKESRLSEINQNEKKSEQWNQLQLLNEEYLQLASNPTKNKIRLQELVDLTAKLTGKVKVIASFPDGVTPKLRMAGDWVSLDNKLGRDYQEAYAGKNWEANSITGYVTNNSWIDQQTGWDNEQTLILTENSVSAEPVIYDEDGNVIPLSERFQTATPDIRFMPAEQGAEPEGLQGIELPTQYRRISDMIPPLRDVEPPVRPVQEMPAEEIKLPASGGEWDILMKSLEGKLSSPKESKPLVKTQEIPVAKVESEQDVADDDLKSNGIDVPESVDDQAVISNAIKIANSKSWKKGRDLKMDIQQRVLEAAEKAGVKISERTLETIEYLTRVGLKDGLIALEQNPNAIGWYDEKTKQALGVMSLLFPEIATDENARFAFTWALAVTSNGLKVDKNFELAEKVYRAYRKTGKMPTNIQAGQAQKAINQSLGLFNQLTKEWGIDNTRKFMQTEFTVGEISRLGVVNKSSGNDIKPGGEYADTVVRGASILGPKIGNGFFSNLYGLFDALTMDRWLVRTWGRWTGTLVELNPELTKQAAERTAKAVNQLTIEDKSRFDEMLGEEISQMNVDELATSIQKASMKPELREVMNQTETGEELRKSGNSLAKYLDGQKEAPASPAERNFIREIFGLMLDDLKADPKYADLTMADLQAVLWYAEKRLYEIAKVKDDQESVDESDADGYEDDEAPDYANAAIGVARKKGISEKRINEVLEKIKNDRATATRLATEGRSEDQTGEQKSAGGFVGREKQKFKHYVAVSTARRNRTGNAKALWTYSRGGGKDSGDAGVLKPKSKKNLGVKYVSEWKPGRKLATMFRNNGLPTAKFLELDSTDKQSAQKFADTLQESKNASVNGAAVYVYPVEDYQGMRLFIAESGKSGFAIKPDGDIVSVFSMEKGSGRSVMEAAIAAGGKKLDAFDTILPEFYGEHGFVEAARIPWNDEFSPAGWNKDTFKKFNNGEPDVVMMVLDPNYTGEYTPRTDIYATDYDTAVQMQDVLLQKIEKSGKKKK